jgi:hypothetical protein
MFNNNLIYKLYHGWWKNIDKTIFLLVLFLFSLGLFFSLASTSLIASDKLETNNYFFFFKHLAYILLGITILVFFSSLSEHNLFRLSILLFLISLFFLILVPIVGTEVKGAKRWLELFFLPRFQPIEFVKQLKNFIKYEQFNDLISLLKKIFFDIKTKKNNKHQIILFSPAAASFDSFNNFEDRGKYFNNLIKKLINV